jgi:hypothetical protein
MGAVYSNQLLPEAQPYNLFICEATFYSMNKPVCGVGFF